MHLPKWLAVPLVALTLPAAAQLAAQDPDWKELDAPPPPAFELSRLLPFEVSAGSTLKFGIDPATLQLGSDGILRYVVVARSSTGTVNAMYEGLRCSTGEVRTYARFNASSGWTAADSSAWKSIWSSQPSRHTLMFARQGGCVGNAPPRTTQDVVRELKNQNFEKIR